jgi:hypothetical protein
MAHPQGIEGSGREGPGETLGSPWIPLPYGSALAPLGLDEEASGEDAKSGKLQKWAAADLTKKFSPTESEATMIIKSR